MSDTDLSTGESTVKNANADDSHPSGVSTLAAYHSLRSLINLILVGLVVLSSSIAIFMIRDIQIARRQTREMEGRIVAYQQEVVPRIKELEMKLGAFTRVHPEFAPIYTKYFIPGTNGPAVGRPADSSSAELPPRR